MPCRWPRTPARFVWVGTQDGLFQMDRQKRTVWPVAPETIRREVDALLKDADGNSWAATQDGLFRISGSQVSVFGSTDGLSDARVLSLFEDREGSLWVGTASGLDRFRDTKFTSLTTKEGLPSNQTSLALANARRNHLYPMPGWRTGPDQGRRHSRRSPANRVCHRPSATDCSKVKMGPSGWGARTARSATRMEGSRITQGMDDFPSTCRPSQKTMKA